MERKIKNAEISDLLNEKWLRMRNDGLLVWKTKDGKIIPLKDLDDSHLDNIINMLSEQSDKEEMFYDALSGFPEKFL